MSQARFEMLFAQHSRAILGYLMRRVEPTEDAADLMSEVFTTCWRRIHDVPAGDDARLWLYGVARNVLANHRRGAARRDRLTTRLRDHLTTRSYDSSTTGERVGEALASLSNGDREIITLTAWEGLTCEEIALLLKIKPTAVRARLSRARKRLRESLVSLEGAQ